MLPIWRYFLPISLWGALFAWRNIREGIDSMNYPWVGFSVCGGFAWIGLFISLDVLLLPASLAAAMTAGLIHLVAPEPAQIRRA